MLHFQSTLNKGCCKVSKRNAKSCESCFAPATDFTNFLWFVFEPDIRAGQVLRGKVVVVTPPRHIEPGTYTVNLSMYGKEKTRVYRDEDNSSLQYQFFLFNLQLQHPDWAREIRPGTMYVLPFQIPLPQSLPASTAFKQGWDFFRIQYKLKASVGPRIKRTIYVNVTSAILPVEQRVPYVAPPQTFDLKCMKLIKRGQVIFAAKVDNTHVRKNQHVTMYLACQNDSTVDIRQIRISLVECCRYTSMEDCSPLAPSNPYIENTLLLLDDVNSPGLDRLRKSRHDAREAATRREETHQWLNRQLALECNRVLIQIPSHLADTFQGQLGNISHALVIDVKTDKRVTNPSITIPLQVGNPLLGAIRSSSAGPPESSVTSVSKPSLEPTIVVPAF